MDKCNYKSCQNNKRPRSIYCSEECRNKNSVVSYRQRIKAKAVEYKGNKCVCCGYDKCVSALHFHHKNESEKDFGISHRGLSRKWELVKEELDKCVMVCANCHAEIHAGLRTIPG